MRIFRTGAQLGEVPHYGGIYEIELTPEELRDAYETMKLCYYAQDIAQNISERIEDAGVNDRFAPDWSMRVGEASAIRLRNLMEGSERFGEVWHDLVDSVVTEVLRECNLDPETMRKKAQ